MKCTQTSNIHTIVIAAAGKGVRMQHLASDRPKHLVEVSGKPFLYYLLTTLQRVGMTRIIVVIDYFADQMETFCRSLDSRIETIRQSDVVGSRVGTAAALDSARLAVRDEPFIFMYGDTLLAPELFDHVRIDDGYSHLLGMTHDDPSRYGVLEVEGDFVKKIYEKPQHPSTNIINVGLYLFQPEIFSAIDEIGLSSRGEYEVTDAINILAKSHHVKVTIVDRHCVDLGRPHDIPSVERFIVLHHLQ